MNFESLAEIEPKLADLYEKARAFRLKSPGSEFCANEIWYGFFKPEISKLVGWDAVDERLSSPQAYDCAYETIYDALPDCVHGGPGYC